MANYRSHKLIFLLILLISYKTAAFASGFDRGTFETAASDFDQGTAAYNQGNFETALKERLPIADRGYAEAQYWVGVLYLKGQGVEKNTRVAREWLKKAVKGGPDNRGSRQGSSLFTNQHLAPAHSRFYSSPSNYK